MFGHRDAPTIRSYEWLRKTYDETTPMRTTGAIPYGNRRKHDRQYLKLAEDGSVAVYLYQTPVVTVHPDNTATLRTGGWASQTTAQFLYRVLPTGSVRLSRDTLVYGCGGSEYVIRDGLRINLTTGVPLNPVRETKMVINRVAANAVRKRYATFIKYVKGMNKVRADEHGLITLSMAEIASRYMGMHSDPIQSQMLEQMQSDDPAQWMNAYGVLCVNARPLNTSRGYIVDPTKINATLNTFLLRAHAKEVLEDIPLEIGEIATNNPYAYWR